MTGFDHLVNHLNLFVDLRRSPSITNLKLLNVGTDHKGEHHWRLRTSDGQVMTLRLEIEEP